MTVQTTNADAMKPNVLVGLDACDRLVMRVGAALYIHGWAFSADVDIEALYVECNGIRYSTTYPIKRPGLDIAKGTWINAASVFPLPPHQQDLNRDTDAPYDFGFVSAAIALESANDETVEVVVIAKVCGQEHRLLTRQIQLLKSNPELDYFNHGVLGSFKQPVDFQTSRVVSIDNHAPVFLVGQESSIRQVTQALKERGAVVSNSILFAQMLATIKTCYETYCEYDFLYFNALKAQFNDYGISKVDIYALINRVIAHFHEQSLRSEAKEGFFALSGEHDVDLIPLLKTIYPGSVFVLLEDGMAPEGEFARKIRVLRDGNARVNFHQIQLGGLSEPTPISHAVEKILRFARSPEQNPSVALDVKNAAANSTIDLRGSSGESYLQALPVISEHKPIFILGAGRSGTSAMTGALKVSGIAGFHEGHVLPLMDEMAQRLWSLAVWDERAVGSSSNARADTIRLVVKTCFDQAYGDMGSKVWLDKTADHLMIHCLPLLVAMFPNARFLFLTRHPIAVAESRRRKFGETPYFSLLEWKKCVIGWNDRKHLLNESSYMECDAKELRSEHLHQQVSSFLGLDPQSSKTLSEYLATQSPEMTRQMPFQTLQAAYASLKDSRLIDSKAFLLSLLDTLEIHIEDTDWNKPTVAWVKRFLGALPEQFGYVLHRPENLVTDLIATFTKLMEEQRHIVEVNEKSIVAWKEQYATQLANASYWKKQHDHQLVNAVKWKEQYENKLRLKPKKNYRKWFSGILKRS